MRGDFSGAEGAHDMVCVTKVVGVTLLMGTH